VNDGVPHNPNRVLLSGDHEFDLKTGMRLAYVCATPETEAVTHLHQHYFGGPADDRSHYRFGNLEEFFRGSWRAKTVWTSEELYYDSFYNSEGFNVVFRPLAYRKQATVNFNEGGKLFGSYPLWRGVDQKPFSREDLAFLEAIAPHVSHGLRVAEATAASDQCGGFLPCSLWGTGIVLMDIGGKVIAMDDRARDAFAQIAGLDGLHVGSFHDQLNEGLDYVCHTLAGIFGIDAISSSTPVTRLFAHRSGLKLRLRGVLVEGADGRRYVTVMVERGESVMQRRTRFAARWGLSPREAEVLELVAAGKTNPEIGTILGLSPLTVKKHAERILVTLGVETRTAAAATFLQDSSRQ